MEQSSGCSPNSSVPLPSAARQSGETAALPSSVQKLSELCSCAVGPLGAQRLPSALIGLQRRQHAVGLAEVLRCDVRGIHTLPAAPPPGPERRSLIGRGSPRRPAPGIRTPLPHRPRLPRRPAPRFGPAPAPGLTSRHGAVGRWCFLLAAEAWCVSSSRAGLWR